MGGGVVGPADDKDDNLEDHDIYICYDEVSVCLCVTKNIHFLLEVSCNHL